MLETEVKLIYDRSISWHGTSTSIKKKKKEAGLI